MAESLPDFMSKCEYRKSMFKEAITEDELKFRMCRETQEQCLKHYIDWCDKNDKTINDFIQLVRFQYDNDHTKKYYPYDKWIRCICIITIFKSVYHPDNHIQFIPATEGDGIKGLEDFYESIREDIG